MKRLKELRLNDEEKSKAISKVLGEAIGFDISDPALKVKNLLLGLSIVLLAMVVGGVSVGKTVSFLGISLEGITGNKMVIGLVIAVCWVTIHHSWYSVEAIKEWRIRLTGQRVAYQTGAGMFGSPHDEAPINPKHASLYNWWREQKSSVASTADAVAKFEEELVGVQEKVDVFLKTSSSNEPPANIGELMNLLRSIGMLNENLTKNLEFMSSLRIESSLYRFDEWFWRLITVQNIRVVLIEILFPLVLGISALTAGGWYLHCNPA
ncbi:hypothetical protein [Pseudomonas glycinae]|uniref:hypothetical protein n=1 Tax=Pseudomonas glycinae TaxID=1785145 RepID=UPI002B1D51CF|nr:hypothetical protein [Pseudomonas glycinae]